LPGRITFDETVEKAVLRGPAEGFEEVTQEISIRKDPLTGDRCRINIQRARRPKQAPKTLGELQRLVEESRKGCFFCPQNLQRMTPKFSGRMPERIVVGRSTVFPNLYPFSPHHAVATVSTEHFLELDQVSAAMLEDCLTACMRYLRLAFKEDPKARWWQISWNYLPPAAASIIHPHLQVLADHRPTPAVARLLAASRRYHRRTGSSYWRDIIEEEDRIGERLIGSVGGTVWVASFAPRGSAEVMGIVPDVSSLGELDAGQVSDLARALSQVLSGYQSIGVRSFNMATFSGPCPGGDPAYALNLRLVSRPIPSPFYVGDDGFMEKLQQESVIDRLPEEVARSLSRAFAHR